MPMQPIDDGSLQVANLLLKLKAVVVQRSLVLWASSSHGESEDMIVAVLQFHHDSNLGCCTF